jgi:hypothetical protein
MLQASMPGSYTQVSSSRAGGNPIDLEPSPVLLLNEMSEIIAQKMGPALRRDRLHVFFLELPVNNGKTQRPCGEEWALRQAKCLYLLLT